MEQIITSRGLKQHLFISSWLWRSEVWMGHGWVLCSESHKAKIKAVAKLSLDLEVLGANSTSKLVWVVVRIQSPAAKGLRSSSPCPLSARDWHKGSPVVTSHVAISSPQPTGNLSYPSSHFKSSSRKVGSFQGTDQVRSTQENLRILSQLCHNIT